MNPLSRNALVGYLAATFAAGAVAGGFVTWSYLPKTTRRPPQENSNMAKRMLDNFTRDLQLNPDQVEKFRPIVEATDREMGEIHRETGRRMRETFEKCNAQMVPILDEKQRGLLEEMKKRMERRGADRRKEHAPGEKPPEGVPTSPK
jgi:Spy/CpxP family protein refolding chaperone